MSRGLIAKAAITIDAPKDKVWDALIKPELIKQYMFGADVISDWKEGSALTLKGVWQGKPYEDKGRILKMEPGEMIKYSHYSPLSGKPDTPENYHTITYELSSNGNQTAVSLSQDNNANENEKAHSEKMWGDMLAGMKKVVEK